MNHLRTFGRFWYDFVVGDDWRIAIGVVAAVVATVIGVHHGLDGWWIIPIVAVGLLAYSVVSVTRSSPRRREAGSGGR
ncbi:MAG: hypothetical protein JWM05_2762 [Acidimicrobiales bacterium]|nr:hypothetical protein [Acidimicrobiales bacterium]